MTALNLPKRLQTPSQTVGPFFAYGLVPAPYGYDMPSLFTPVLAQPQAAGEHILITGCVFDGATQTIADALVEISHVDARGQPVTTAAEAQTRSFTGFGRCGTGTLAGQHYAFNTIKPGWRGRCRASPLHHCVRDDARLAGAHLHADLF